MKITKLLIGLMSIAFFACGSEKSKQNTAQTNQSKKVASKEGPECLFTDTKVLRLDISIEPQDWTAMMDNLESSFGSISENPRPTPNAMEKPGPPHVREDSLSHQHPPKIKGNKQMLPPHQTNGPKVEKPIWEPCTVKYKNKTLPKVGIRLKGNSSLRTTYRSGNKKFSFKLDFEQFEDDFPKTKNRRFYGMKQLNLNNNFDDASLIREKVASDLFRQFGLISARTSFCEVYINNGSGSPQFFGIYTLVEEIDDTGISEENAEEGNLYKPENRAATFEYGSYKEEELNKKNHKKAHDYSDVKSLYEVLHSPLRLSDPLAWQQKLESVFNVDVFLKWLAVNTSIQNWDSYGVMAHNYYLYHNPSDSLLTWIPWDNNEAFAHGKMGGALTYSLDVEESRWPLIAYIMAQAEYQQRYHSYLKQFNHDLFNAGQMHQIYSRYYQLLRSYAYNEKRGYTFLHGPYSFDEAIEALKQHVLDRSNTLNTYFSLAQNSSN